MNNNSNPVYASPEPIVQDTTQHGSSDQASINNILQQSSRSNPTRTMPTDFTLEQGGQPTKRRKSGATYVMPPPHQSDQAYMQQGQYYLQQQMPVYMFPPQPMMRQTMAVPSSRNNSNTSLPINRSQRTVGYPETINAQVVLPSPDQVISNQNNQHAPNQIVSQQIGFANQMQINNSQQQQQQHMSQQLSQQLLQQHGNNQQILNMINGQLTLYPMQQVQPPIQPIHTSPSLINNQVYDLSAPMLTHDTILQRLEILKTDLSKKDNFLENCSELVSYLQTDIAYSPQCQDLFIRCLKQVKGQTAVPEIGSKVLDAALKNIHRFTNTTFQNQIRKWSGVLSGVVSQQFNAQTMNNANHLVRSSIPRQQLQSQQINASVNPPRIEQRQITDFEKANANWISRIIDRAWGHVMLPYESLIVNQHQEQPGFVNSFYVPHEKFDRIWKQETPFPPTFVHPDKLPLTYRLISRKPSNIDDDNKCDWPPEETLFGVKINDSEVKLHRKQRIPIKNNQYSFVGVDRPVDIGQYLVAGVNRIKVTHCMCEPCRQQLCEHVLSIEVLLKETEELVLRNARNQVLTVEHGMEIVKHLISGPSSSKTSTHLPTSPTSSIGTPGQNNVTMIIDDDNDVTVNKMSVSLRCPISLLRITEPAKGQHCRHIGCFDLESYVSVNKKNGKWRCPKCNDRVTSETLRIDEYFKKLLKQIPENVNTVELDSSGKWTVVGHDDGDGDTTDDDDMQVDPMSKKASTNSTSSKFDKAPAEIIILDDDDDDDDDDESEILPQNTLPPSSQNTLLPSLQNTLPPSSQNILPPSSQNTLPYPSQKTLPHSSQNNQVQIPVQRPTVIRQSSTPGVPYMQPIIRSSNIQMNDQSQSTTNSIIQSPPLTASLPSPNMPITIMQTHVQSDPIIYMEPMSLNNNNTDRRKTASQRKIDRRSRHKGTDVATQDRGNSSTKDDNNDNNSNDNDSNNNNNKDNSSSSRRSNWSFVTGIASQQSYNTTLSPQDNISQIATQVVSPISPISVTNPNLSHPIQDKEEEEWETEDEQEEVVLDSSTAANNAIKNTIHMFKKNFS